MSPNYKIANKIMQCDGAEKSYKKLNGKEKSCIDARLKILKEGGLRFEDQIVFYSKYNIYAIKLKRKIFNLRVYGFFDNEVFYISHYVKKTWNKLRVTDVNKVLSCKKGINI